MAHQVNDVAEPFLHFWPTNHEQSKTGILSHQVYVRFLGSNKVVKKINREINSKVENREAFIEKEFWRISNMWMQKNS